MEEDNFEYSITPGNRPKQAMPQMGNEGDFEVSIGRRPPPPAAQSESAAVRHPEQKENMSLAEVGQKAIQNAPASAKAFAESIAYPFMNPSETVEGVKAVGKGLYSKAAGALGATQNAAQKEKDEAAVNAIGKFYSDRYGSVDGFKNAFANDPIGVLADAATVMTGGGGLAAKAPGLVGKAGKAVSTVGRTIDPLNVAAQGVKAAAKGATAVASVPEWFSTGASLSSLNNAAKAGLENNKTFVSHLAGLADPADAVRRIEDVHSAIAKERSAKFVQDMGKIAQEPLSYQPIQDALSKAWGDVTRSGTVIHREAADKLLEVQQKLNEFRANKNITPNVEAFQDLKEAIRDIGNSYQLNTVARSKVNEVANAVKNQIASLPNNVGKNYLNIMEEYADRSRQLAEVRNAFLGGRSDAGRIRKILSAKDDKFKTNLLADIAKYDPEIPYIVAGLELQPWMPSGIRGQISGILSGAGLGGGFGFIHGLAGAAAHSPRVIGSANYATGYLAGAPARFIEANPMLSQIPFQAGRAAQEVEEAENRTERASGGRVGGIAARLVNDAARAHKYHQKTTEEILDAPDEHVVKALSVAKAHI